MLETTAKNGKNENRGVAIAKKIERKEFSIIKSIITDIKSIMKFPSLIGKSE